jgi:hypothetical protein
VTRQGAAIATGALLLLVGTGSAAAQAQATGTPGDPLDAPCALLSAAEVNQATGRRDYEDGMPMGVRSAELDGASLCAYGFAEMAFDPSETPPPITVALAAAGLGESSVEQLLREGPRTGCKRETVPDVGQVAFVEACAEDMTLYAHVAAYELIVAISYVPSLSRAASDAALLTVAKAAAAQLRN